MPLDDLTRSSLLKSGQRNFDGSGGGDRIIYPAIVVPNGTNDYAEQNRILARIVSVDDNGNIVGKKSSNEENYNNYSGKDRTILDGDLVTCIPLLPEFFHVRPQSGEMVFAIMENPKDTSAVRYWIGPIITSKLKLQYQGYEDSVKVFDKTFFNTNKKIDDDLNILNLFPTDSDVAIQGRADADLILKNRESLLIAGKLNRDTLTVNTETPSYLNLKQFDNAAPQSTPASPINPTHLIQITLTDNSATTGKIDGQIKVIYIKTNYVLNQEANSYGNIIANTTTPDTVKNRSDVITWLKSRINEYKIKYKQWSFSATNIVEFKNDPATYSTQPTPPANVNLLQKYSQANLISTNVNIYSTRGKYRGDDVKSFEINKDLESFGDLANKLHPAIFGDEVVRLLDLIIKFLLTHTNTPQMPPLETAISKELAGYTVDGKLQNLLSYHIRIN